MYMEVADVFITLNYYITLLTANLVLINDYFSLNYFTPIEYETYCNLNLENSTLEMVKFELTKIASSNVFFYQLLSAASNIYEILCQLTTRQYQKIAIDIHKRLQPLQPFMKVTIFITTDKNCNEKLPKGKSSTTISWLRALC